MNDDNDDPAERFADKDNVVSTRFFNKPRGQVYLWPPIDLNSIHGGDENCNRTIGFSHPWGVLYIAFSFPLRQKRCRKCLREGNCL